MYKITFEKSVDVYAWSKDDLTVRVVTVNKWPSYIFPEKPDMSKYDELEGVEEDSLGDCQFDGDVGGITDFEFPQEMKKREQKQFEKAYEEDGFDAIEELGWEDADRQTFVKGGYEIEELKLDK